MAQKVFSNFLFHEKISCVEETPVRGRKPTEKPKPSSLRIYSLTGLEYLFGVEPDFLTTITRDEILFFRNDDTFLQRESVKERNADDESPLACVRCINDMQHGLSTLLSQTFLQELPFCGPDSSDEDFLREPFKETNHSVKLEERSRGSRKRSRRQSRKQRRKSRNRKLRCESLATSAVEQTASD